MGPPSSILYLPDDADLLAFAAVPGVNINYVMKNVMLVFATEVYQKALQLLGQDNPIDVYDIPQDIYLRAISLASAGIARHKAMPTEQDKTKIWKTRMVFVEGFSIPVPLNIPNCTLRDMRIHCYFSDKKDRVATRLWNELSPGQKSSFVKTLIRQYMDRPILEPRIYPDAFPMEKRIAKGTESLKTREWVSQKKTSKPKKKVSPKQIPVHVPDKEPDKPKTKSTPTSKPDTANSGTKEALISSFMKFVH